MINFFHRQKEPAELMFHTDIHCHLVPGVDDGSPDAATSAELIERMSKWGIRRIIATPHVTQDTFENTPDVLDPALDELHEELRRRGITTQVTRSAEYRIDDFFRSQLDAGIITPFPGNYLLVENSFLQEPWNLDQFIFDLKVKGYKPILAHPERYLYYRQFHPKRYAELYGSGTLMQVNLLSLAGYYGKEEKSTAEMLLEKGYAQFIGTDLHHHRHADSIEQFLTTKGYRKLVEKVTVLNDTAFTEQ